MELRGMVAREDDFKDQKTIERIILSKKRSLTKERVKRFILARVLSERKIDSLATLIEEGEMALLPPDSKSDLDMIELKELYRVIRAYCEGDEKELKGGTGLPSKKS